MWDVIVLIPYQRGSVSDPLAGAYCRKLNARLNPLSTGKCFRLLLSLLRCLGIERS